MNVEAKKLHIIERILNINNSAVLDAVQTVIRESETQAPPYKTFRDFVGIWTEQEAAEMERIIEEGCEQINPDDWK